MTLHPAEVAKEIKTYPFFEAFDESLLLQISTMVRETEFKANDYILRANQMNNMLYFIRSGTVEVLVDGERVNELNTFGDVFGEMSVLSGNPVSADLRAKTDLVCFSINGDDFAHVHPSQKERFQILLLRIYAGILSDRLVKTNNKAKMYEVTARELAVKKKELELVTSAQMNFLRSESKSNLKKVLLVEPTKKQQSIIKTAMGSTGVQLQIAGSAAEAQNLYHGFVPDLIFCESSCDEFLSWVQSQNFQGQMVLIEGQTLDFQKHSALSFVQNVVSRDPEDRAGTVKSLLTALSKILHHNHFGIEKYLAWGTEVHSQKVTGSKVRYDMREKMVEHFKSVGIRGAILDRLNIAAEEMLMNAVYDAPTDSQGQAVFNHLPRTTEIELEPKYQADFSYGCDGNLLAVSVQDPNGALSRDIIIKYLESCYAGRAGSLNTGKGGAGRGLHQILESCDWTVFNVKPGERTEVIGLFDIDQKRDGQPLFHYFFVK